MTPIDFIRDYDHYNEPLGARMDALDCELEITDGVTKYEILSYYLLPNGRMCLDIQAVTEKF